jgi:hypothetical protein
LTTPLVNFISNGAKDVANSDRLTTLSVAKVLERSERVLTMRSSAKVLERSERFLFSHSLQSRLNQHEG